MAESEAADVILIGDSGAGKSALLQRLLSNEFLPHQNEASETRLEEYQYQSLGGRASKLKIIDSHEMDKSPANMRFVFPNSGFAVLLFSSEEYSYEKLMENSLKWTKFAADADSKCKIIISLSKIDAISQEQRALIQENAAKVANRVGAINSICTSSLTGENVKELFDYIARESLRIAEEAVNSFPKSMDSNLTNDRSAGEPQLTFHCSEKSEGSASISEKEQSSKVDESIHNAQSSYSISDRSNRDEGITVSADDDGNFDPFPRDFSLIVNGSCYKCNRYLITTFAESISNALLNSPSASQIEFTIHADKNCIEAVIEAIHGDTLHKFGDAFPPYIVAANLGIASIADSLSERVFTTTNRENCIKRMS